MIIIRFECNVISTVCEYRNRLPYWRIYKHGPSWCIGGLTIDRDFCHPASYGIPSKRILLSVFEYNPWRKFPMNSWSVIITFCHLNYSNHCMIREYWGPQNLYNLYKSSCCESIEVQPRPLCFFGFIVSSRGIILHSCGSRRSHWE
jgi:hypothetical protein